MGGLAVGDRHDYVALEWVRGEIAETLKQARQSLETFVEQPGNSTGLSYCLAYLHQVNGILQMVQFFGAALLAEEMELLAQALLDEKVANVNEALDVLMQAILQLPRYLERVQTARRDLPMAVLPLLNDLRAARGDSFMSQSGLFNPVMPAELPETAPERFAGLDSFQFAVFLRKIRQTMQVSLIGLARGQQTEQSLIQLARVFAGLEKLSAGTPVLPLWQAASGLVDGLANCSLELSTAVRSLLRQLDGRLRKLVHDGVDGLNQPPPRELLKNILFYVAKAQPNSERLQLLHQTYHLADALPPENLEAGTVDRGTIRSVVTALCEELLRVKDSLDLFVRGNHKALGELEELRAPLKQIADTLAMLGFAQQRKTVLEQAEALQEMATGNSPASDAALMDIAGALLYLEATLVGMAGSDEVDSAVAEMVAPTDLALVHRMVIREARIGLEQTKDGIIEFIASQWQHQNLEPVSDLLNQVRGGLAMIPLPRAARLVSSVRRYIDEQLLASRLVPDWQDLDALADAISSIDYHLERMYEDQTGDSEQVLDAAAVSMASLGYPIVDERNLPNELYDLGWGDQEAMDTPLPQPVEESRDNVIADSGSDLIQETVQVAPGVPAVPLLFDSFDESAAKEVAELSIDSFELPEVELPQAATAAAEGQADDGEAGGLAILAATSAINPPAKEMLEHLLPPPADEEPVDEELQEVFVEEAGEVLETLVEVFPQWQQNPADDKALTEVRRAFHTLKGSGRMVRALIVGELAWAIENMLNRVIEGGVETSAPLLQVITDVVDLLPELIEEYAGQSQRQRDDVDRLAAIAHALAKKEALPTFAGDEEQAERTDKAVAELEEQAETADADELDPVLLEIFHGEALGHLQVLLAFVEECRTELPRLVSEELQRAMHTLKGSAHMAGINPVTGLATVCEQMVKEYRAHLLKIGEQEAGLLERCARLLSLGVEQLFSTPLQPLAGTDELISDVEQLLEQQLSCEQQASRIAPVSLLTSRFLVKDMSLLLNMEDLLQLWRNHPAEPVRLHELNSELVALKNDAQMTGLEPVEALAHALSVLYQQLHAGCRQLGDGQIDRVVEAHEALISMMDEVAAGLDVTPQSELVADLQQLATSVGPDAAQEPECDRVPIPVIEPEVETTGEEVAAEKATVIAYADFEPELLEIFLDEALELMDSANRSLERWLASPAETDSLAILMRDLHTLKGGARMADITSVGDLAHELESIYEDLIDGSYKTSQPLAELLHAGHDQLTGLLEQLHNGQDLSSPQVLIGQLLAFRRDGTVAPRVQEDALAAALPDQPVDATADVDTAAVEQDELVGIFLDEAFEIIGRMDAVLQNWQFARNNPESVESLLRDLHTLKGGARLAEITEVAELAHELELLCEDLMDGRMEHSDELGAFLYFGHGQLNELLEAVRDQRPPVSVAAVLETARNWQRSLPSAAIAAVEPLKTEEPASFVAQPEEQVTSPVAGLPETPAAETLTATAGRLVKKALPFMRKDIGKESSHRQQQGPQEMVRIPAELLEELVNLAGESSIFRSRVEQQVSDFGFTLHEVEITLDRIRDQLRRLDTETQAQILSRLQTEGGGSDYAEFDPLEMDRHSQLQQLSRSLFESASDLLELKETLSAKSRDAETLLLQQARVNTELQEGLMRTRMVPFERLVPRLRRTVRQISAELGKQAELLVANAEGEMDRSVMERMLAPLEHMLRNAVGHGLEEPDVRLACGKPETGLIRLELAREGADILLTLSDDGCGINIEAVRKKAIEKGLMQAGSELSDHEIMQFVLHAGFSTAKEVTQVSGRGVGMDVVSAEIKQLGGSISIESGTGKGTRFLIRLPFTVSVNRALMVTTGEDLYAIPLNTIEGIVRISPHELEILYSRLQEGQPAHYEYAGQSYDLKYLGDLLVNGQQPKLVGQTLPLPVVLVRSSEHAVAVQVDSLAGSREIVVKSLGPQFAGVPSLSGATILGDGRVVVILDLLATIRSSYAQQLVSAGRSQPRQLPRKPVISERGLHVMVVDDSVTVRKVTSRLLERYGMHVTTAKDGIDAINQLQEQRPDIMLLDIEMPRMDGFEVATLVRHDEQLRDLPIIMVTSRTGDKHRERALAIGVNEYLGKPYQETELLDTIRELTS